MAKASAFIDGALQDIELLGASFLSYNYRLKDLQVGLRNLRTFLLCARGCDSSVVGSLLNRLENSLIQNGKDFHNLCLRQKEKRIRDDLFQGVIQLKKCISSFRQEIMESYITLSNYWSRQCRYQSEEFFDSLLVNMADIMRVPDFHAGQDPNLIDAFKKKLVFFINFIRFAELRGFDPCQLQVLFTRLHDVAVNAAILCYHWTLVPYIDQMKVFDEFLVKFSELLLKIKPVDPQIREIYVGILISKISPSSHSLTLEKDKHVLGDFVDTLLCNILEALSYSDSYMVSLKDQVPILYEGLRFLRIILTKHLEKIDELHEKAKDLIGAAVNEAAIVICSLPVYELEEGLVKEMDFALFNFLERIKLIKVITSVFIFSKTNEHGFIDFLLENLKQLLSCTVDSIAFAKDEIWTIQEYLVSVRSFLESILDTRKHDGEFQSLWRRVVDVAYKTCFLIRSLVFGDIPNCSSLEFRTIIEEIYLLKMESLAIVDNHYNSDFEAQKPANTFNPLPSLGSTPAINNNILEDERNTIIEKLITGSNQLDIISIVGMPGIGKTSLARSVYDNPSVMDCFHIRAWCVVSQVDKKTDLLLQILGSIISFEFFDDEYLEKNEETLAEELYRCLWRKRYLIVLDDVWDDKAWSCLKRCFPDDGNSSRILLTSRNFGFAKSINPGREPYTLRLLTDNECWDLLQKKLPSLKSYRLDLGMKIAKRCRGLPLTVVIVAEVLENSDQDSWEEIEGRLSLNALLDKHMDILELSFRKLPEYLKSCFLYFASFPVVEEIPLKKLIWLWIAEGLIEKSGPKSLEDVAKDYMNDLISRGLVMVSKERSIGGIKTCRIHDLLHEFCVVKAKKEKFLSLVSGHDELFAFLGQGDLQRLSVHSTPQDFEKSKLFYPGVRSLLSFAKADDDSKHYNISFIFHFFKLLKVLDLENINLGSTFPSEIALLVELRYLAIRGMFKSIPSTVANLSNLETLLVYADSVLLADTVWNLPKLRVLWSFRSFYLYDSAIDNLESSSSLHVLDTFSTLELSHGQSLGKIMRNLPNIRRLRCKFPESGGSDAACNEIVEMDFLFRLESLHLKLPEMSKYRIEFCFPVNLKKLTLSGFHSCSIPTGRELPNLVALKLCRIDFEWGTWDMNEEWEFPKLKYLELDDLRISRWTGIDDVDHFPCLEKLVLQNFWKLEEVPSCFGYIANLQMIKVRGCHKSVENLFLAKREELYDYGIELQVLLEKN